MTNKKTNNKEVATATSQSGKLKGVAMLFVVGSIVYSTAVVAMGLEGYEPLVLITPQALFAAYVLYERFTK